ncbi:MAG: DUF4414 domain-containing protein [Acidimicrobiia bacterium]|nr:DUF4414 domain-containing protein [Acidimicrobiia bacterium]
MPQNAQADESTDVDDLPPEVIDALPADIRQEILDGVRDQIPEEVIQDLRPDIADKIPDSLVDAGASNPGLTAVIVVIGLLAVAGAVWGAVKGFLKVAIGLGLIAAVVWWYFLSGR